MCCITGTVELLTTPTCMERPVSETTTSPQALFHSEVRVAPVDVKDNPSIMKDGQLIRPKPISRQSRVGLVIGTNHYSKELNNSSKVSEPD